MSREEAKKTPPSNLNSSKPSSPFAQAARWRESSRKSWLRDLLPRDNKLAREAHRNAVTVMDELTLSQARDMLSDEEPNTDFNAQSPPVKKFGSWGSMKNSVNEDWDDDFEFLDKDSRQSDKPRRTPEGYSSIEKKLGLHLSSEDQLRYTQALLDHMNALTTRVRRETRDIKILTVIAIMLFPLSFVSSVFGIGHIEVQGTDPVVREFNLLSMACIAVGAFIIIDLHGPFSNRGNAAAASKSDKKATLKSVDSTATMLTFITITVVVLPTGFISPSFRTTFGAPETTPWQFTGYDAVALNCFLLVIGSCVLVLLYGLIHKGLKIFSSSPDPLVSDRSSLWEPTLPGHGKESSKYSMDRPAGEVQFSAARVAQSPDVAKKHVAKRDVDKRSFSLRALLAHPETVSYAVVVIWATCFRAWATPILASCAVSSSQRTVEVHPYATISILGIGWGLTSSNRVQMLGWTTTVLVSWNAHWYADVDDVCGAKDPMDVAKSLCLLVIMVLLHNWGTRVLRVETNIPDLTMRAVTTILGGALLIAILVGNWDGSGELNQRVKSWLFSCSVLGIGGLVGTLLDWSMRQRLVLPLLLELTPTAQTRFDRMSDWMSLSLQHSRWRLKDFFHTSKTWLESWRTQILEPRLQADRVRIRFKCACGVRIWDDYPAELAS